MSTKRWRMTVVELGSESPLGEATVEANNWMGALKQGRAVLGEPAAVPTGSSCSVAADGKVTILDPIDRRRFVLVVDPNAPFTEGAAAAPKVPTDPAPKEELHGENGTPPAKKKNKLKQTMAYVPQPAPAEPSKGKKKRSVKKTMAYLPPDDAAALSALARQAASNASVTDPAPSDAGTEANAEAAEEAATQAPDAPAPEAAKVEAPQEAEASSPTEANAETPKVEAPKEESLASIIVAPDIADAPAPEGASGVVVSPDLMAPDTNTPAPQEELHDGGMGVHAPTNTAWKLLHQRNEDPSDASPLTYRERSYALTGQVDDSVAEAIARERANALMRLLDDAPKGRFINVAVFDHEWIQQPRRPPVVTVALKDWQGEAIVERPAAVHRASAPPPGRRSTDEHDRRLSDAFEACQDLLFLGSPLEAMEFVQRLLSDLIPCEGITACLYDIDADVHRVVVASGPGGEAKRGTEIGHGVGLFGTLGGMTQPLLADGSDPRFDAAVEGREGVTVGGALYLPSSHNGRHLAALQLFNRQGGAFTQADADLGFYVTTQLGEFLYRARIAAGQRAQ